jgi:hypothetical protein
MMHLEFAGYSSQTIHHRADYRKKITTDNTKNGGQFIEE